MIFHLTLSPPVLGLGPTVPVDPVVAEAAGFLVFLAPCLAVVLALGLVVVLVLNLLSCSSYSRLL